MCVSVGEEEERDSALHCIIIMVACFNVGREGGRERVLTLLSILFFFCLKVYLDSSCLLCVIRRDCVVFCPLS